MAEFVVIAHVTVVLLVALYKNDVCDTLLGVDLVGERYLMLFPALLDSVAVLVFAWGDVFCV